MERTPATFFVDNASIAGAGRALYDAEPDRSDVISLMHVVTAALLADELHIDGSSRFIQFRVYDAEHGSHETTEPTPAIWTWESRYPALQHFCPITDGFWQRQLGFDSSRIVTYLLATLGQMGKDALDRFDMDLIPKAYFAPEYFDLGWLTQTRQEFERGDAGAIGEQAFKVLLFLWRGIYYYELAKLVGRTYSPNPLRSKFIEPFMAAGRSVFAYEATALEQLSKAMLEPRLQLVRSYAKEKEKEYELNLSPFFAYVLRRCRGERVHIAEQVARLRATARFQDLRGWIAEYDAAYRRDDLLTLGKMQAKLKQSMANFARRHAITDNSIRIVPKLSLGVAEIKGADDIAALKVKLPGFLFVELFQRPYLSLVWDVADAVLRGGLGLEQVTAMAPIPRSGAAAEWIIMEAGQMVRFEGSGRHAELGRNDIYPEADIAWAGNEGVFGFDNSFDLMRASSRPAAPPAPDARRPRRRR